MKIETSKATGLALDWGLAVAMGCTSIRQQHTQTLDGPVKIDARDPDGFFIRVDHTDPDLCVWLMSKIQIAQQATDGGWRVAAFCEKGKKHKAHGKTLAESVARCVIAMKLGDEFECPSELGGVV